MRNWEFSVFFKIFFLSKLEKNWARYSVPESGWENPCTFYCTDCFILRVFQSKITLLKENQSKGINRYLWTAAKILLAILVIPPFLNYAALQKEIADLKPEGKVRGTDKEGIWW